MGKLIIGLIKFWILMLLASPLVVPLWFVLAFMHNELHWW